jgi:sec-independent protein translocase protein TatC
VKTKSEKNYKKGMAKKDKSISFFTHLEELRKRLIFCVITIAITSVVAYNQTTTVLKYLSKPLGSLYFLSPVEAFIARMKITLFCGLYLALPIVLYQVWKFVEAGLHDNERRSIFSLVVFSFLLFTVGGVFAYFVMLPIGLKFLLSCGTLTLQPIISVEKYITFVVGLVLSFGLVFQLPIIIFFLTKIGIVNPRILFKQQRYAILIIFIVAAILTPPDVFSQFLMAIPLLVLYELSILISVFAVKRENRRKDG